MATKIIKSQNLKKSGGNSAPQVQKLQLIE